MKCDIVGRTLCRLVAIMRPLMPSLSTVLEGMDEDNLFDIIRKYRIKVLILKRTPCQDRLGLVI